MWVSPRKSEIALVNRDLPIDSLWPDAVAGSMFAVFTLAGVLGIVGALVNARWYRRQHDAVIIWLFSGFWCAISLLFFLLVTGEPQREVAAMIGISVFLLVGIVMLYAAVYSSWLASEAKLAEMSKSLNASSSRQRARPAKREAKVDASKNIKRGGMGGRGDDYDKD